MTDCLDRFFDDAEMGKAAHELMLRADRADVPRLIIALTDPLPSRRGGAVHALGWNRHKDVRIVDPLINVLNNKNEMPGIRAQAAQCLCKYGGRTVVRPLIVNSSDDSEDVRFWCVSSLGALRGYEPWERAKRMPRRALIRAMEARVHDHGEPKHTNLGWNISLEAIASLADNNAAYPPTRLFRETKTRVLSDPIGSPYLWPWAQQYGSRKELRRQMKDAERIVQETAILIMKDPLGHRDLWHWPQEYYNTRRGRALYYKAIQIIKKAALKPADFGPRPRKGQGFQSKPEI